MKFGTYTYNGLNISNLGDSLIVLALLNIYKEMGINPDDIVRINYHNLPGYDGDTVLIPVVSALQDSMGVISSNKLYSPKIIPVFISYVRVSPLSDIDEIEYLKAHSPIGCRDEYTCKECRKHDIEAYLNGCISITFPLRKKKPDDGKVFIVDPEAELLDYIPHEIINNAVFLPHLKSNVSDPLTEADELYKRYVNEASMVITKRQHCAAPCLAAGIPVIMARSPLITNLTWIDRLVRIYNPDEYKEIDWNPKPVEFENHKNNVKDLAVSRIKDAYNKAALGTCINNFYMQVKRDYSKFLIQLDYSQVLSAKQASDESFSYSLYGAGNVIEMIKLFIDNHYPNAALNHIYDKTLAGETYEGVLIEPIENIADNLDEFCIITAVTPGTRREMAQRLVELGKSPETFVFATNTDFTDWGNP